MHAQEIFSLLQRLSVMQTLRLTLFGSPIIQLGEQTLGEHLPTKARALLFYLVASRRTHHRNELASLFWPDMPDTQARKNLRNVLPILRSYVGEHLLVTRNTVAFNRYTSYWLDVEAFLGLLSSPDLSYIASPTLWAAVELATDDFLSGFYVRHAPLFEQWMLWERERLRGLTTEALRTLATRHLEQEEYRQALAATRRLLSLDPWRESAHQMQMLALLGLGQRSEALAQYGICCRILTEEFGAEPNEQTTRLYASISQGNGLSLPRSAPTPPPAPQADSPVVPGPLPVAPLMTLSPDGRWLARPTRHHAIQLEALADEAQDAPIRMLAGHTDPLTALRFNPTSTLLASASVDATVRLWQVGQAVPPLVLTGHTAGVSALAFCPDSRVLASASSDGMLCVWGLPDGHLLYSRQRHSAPVGALAFTPDGARLLSADTTGTVLVWEQQAGYAAPTYRLLIDAEAARGSQPVATAPQALPQPATLLELFLQKHSLAS